MTGAMITTEEEGTTISFKRRERATLVVDEEAEADVVAEEEEAEEGLDVGAEGTGNALIVNPLCLSKLRGIWCMRWILIRWPRMWSIVTSH